MITQEQVDELNKELDELYFQMKAEGIEEGSWEWSCRNIDKAKEFNKRHQIHLTLSLAGAKN